MPPKPPLQPAKPLSLLERSKSAAPQPPDSSNSPFQRARTAETSLTLRQQPTESTSGSSSQRTVAGKTAIRQPSTSSTPQPKKAPPPKRGLLHPGPGGSSIGASGPHHTTSTTTSANGQTPSLPGATDQQRTKSTSGSSSRKPVAGETAIQQHSTSLTPQSKNAPPAKGGWVQPGPGGFSMLASMTVPTPSTRTSANRKPGGQTPALPGATLQRGDQDSIAEAGTTPRSDRTPSTPFATSPTPAGASRPLVFGSSPTPSDLSPPPPRVLSRWVRTNATTANATSRSPSPSHSPGPRVPPSSADSQSHSQLPGTYTSSESHENPRAPNPSEQNVGSQREEPPPTIPPVAPIVIQPADPIAIQPADPIAIQPAEPIAIQPAEPIAIQPADPIAIQRIAQLKNLCQVYMNYALKALGRTEETNNDSPEKLEPRRNSPHAIDLVNKYKLVQSLYLIINNQQLPIEEIKHQVYDKLHEPEVVALMKKHRHNLFTRIVHSLMTWVTSIPSRIAYSFSCAAEESYRPVFFKPPKSEALRDQLLPLTVAP
jgi:hypothetical protein